MPAICTHSEPLPIHDPRASSVGVCPWETAALVSHFTKSPPFLEVTDSLLVAEADIR
jgi:hypothetical protein